jgi:hypothetical protein
MIIDLVGLFAAAALLVTLVALEVRHVGPDTGQPSHRILSPTVTLRVVAILGATYLLVFLPRVLGLLS